MKNKIWLSSPHMGGSEMKYVQQAFDENWIAPLGPNVNGFEGDLEKFLGNDVYVTALSSGTGALHIALTILDIGFGDEVLCQSLTFAASANPIVYRGAKPVFIDSEKDTWNICPNALEEAIIDRLKKGKKPKAIIAVCLYGMPYQYDRILEISRNYDIPLIDDSAEALGSRFKNNRCGTIGDFSVLSFNGNKIITTSGGGALVLKSEMIKQKTLFLATQAKDDALHYEHSEIGYNYRLSNICAGIGRGQMEVLDQWVEKRRTNHFFYQGLLNGIEGIEFQNEPNADYYSNYWLTAILINPEQCGVDKMQLYHAMTDFNIETRPLWKPLHLQPVFSDCDYYGANVSEELFGKGLCMPSGSNLNQEQLDRVAECLNSVFHLY